jgi:hypothetical protein
MDAPGSERSGWIAGFMDEAMNRFAKSIVLVLCLGTLHGCDSHEPRYGSEIQLMWPGLNRQIWAVAPAVDLSGQKQVDPLLQGDLVYQHLQEVSGITVVPVNRVIEVYSSLRIDRVQSVEQARLVCELLGCDALVVPTVTAYDAYNPPKFGAALQVFTRRGPVATTPAVDVRELVRSATPGPNEPAPMSGDFHQVVGMFDAANGTTRKAVYAYAEGRHDPSGPLGAKEYFVNMDRYCGFVYHTLIEQLINEAAMGR